MKDPDLRVGYHGYLFTGGDIPPNHNVIMNKCTHEVWYRNQGVLTLIETPTSFIFVDVENNKAYRVAEERLKRICYNFILKDLLTLQDFRFYNGELSIMLPIFPGGTPTVIINSVDDINGKPAGTHFILNHSLEINSEDVIFPDNSTVTFTANHTSDPPPTLTFDGGSVTGNNITFEGFNQYSIPGGSVVLTGGVNVSNFGLTMKLMGFYHTKTPALTIDGEIAGNFKSLIIETPSFTAVYLVNSNLRVADFRLSSVDVIPTYPLIYLNNSTISIQGSDRNFNINTDNLPLFEIVGVGQFITNHDGTTTGTFNSNNLFYRIAEGSQVFVPRHYKLYTSESYESVSLNGDSDFLKPPLGIYKRPVIANSEGVLAPSTEPATNFIVNNITNMGEGATFNFPPNSVVYLSNKDIVTGEKTENIPLFLLSGGKITGENLRMMSYSGPDTLSTDGGGMFVISTSDVSECEISLINMGNPNKAADVHYHLLLDYTPAFSVGPEITMRFKSLNFYNSFTTSIHGVSLDVREGPTLQFDYLGISQTTPIHSPSKAIIHLHRSITEIIRQLGEQNSFNIDTGTRPLFYIENSGKFTTQLGEAIALGYIASDDLFATDMDIEVYMELTSGTCYQDTENLTLTLSVTDANLVPITIQSPCPHTP